MECVYADGGRSKYFKADNVRDCVTRAICNATGSDYKKIYDGISKLQGKSARNGCKKTATRKYIVDVLGWKWHPTMNIGSGCKTHLRADELPATGTIIVSVSKHITCVKNGVIYDTFDCSRHGNRCVYGYYTKN